MRFRGQVLSSKMMPKSTPRDRKVDTKTVLGRKRLGPCALEEKTRQESNYATKGEQKPQTTTQTTKIYVVYYFCVGVVVLIRFFILKTHLAKPSSHPRKPAVKQTEVSGFV